MFSLEKLGALVSQDLAPTVRVAVFGGDNAAPSAALEDPWEQDYGRVDAIRPDHDLAACITALQASTRLTKLVRTFARNTVGLGWHITPKKQSADAEADADPALDPATIEEDARMTAFFSQCNPDMPLSELAERTAIDREATGNGYIEATRTVGGDLSALYHLPCANMRLRGGEIKGFLQLRDEYTVVSKLRVVYFKKFGDLRVMNKWTGLYDDSTAFQDRATEVVHFKIYSPDSYYYGKPRWLSALPSILVSQQAKQWNLNFVANNASWPIAIITENAELDSTSQQMLRDVTMAKGKGVQGAGRVIFLQAQKKHPAYRGTDSRIRVEKLAMGVQDDGSFLKLIKAGDDELRETFGIAELFLGSAGDLNRASAAVSRQVTNEQEFVPQAKRDEFTFNATFMRALGAELTEFRFNRPRTTDNLQDSQILARLKPENVLDGAEIRNVISKFIPDLNLRARSDHWALLPPKVLQQESSARNTTLAASTKPDSVAHEVLLETATEEIVQRVVDELADLGGDQDL